MSGKPRLTIGVPHSERWRVYESRRKPRPPEFGVWRNMIQRCHNPKVVGFKWYGALGIYVCARWRGPGGFQKFLSDMGRRPTPKHTIERTYNGKPYCPSNCEWATTKVQARNRCNNFVVRFRGRSQCLTDWAEEIGINASTLLYRFRRGWSAKRALTWA